MRAKISLFDRLFGVECPNCQKRSNMREQYNYTRGWNNLCSQACGCNGFYCMECGTVIYTISEEDYRADLPDWCTPSSDTPKARYFPDFKYNRQPRKVANVT